MNVIMQEVNILLVPLHGYDFDSDESAGSVTV